MSSALQASAKVVVSEKKYPFSFYLKGLTHILFLNAFFKSDRVRIKTKKEAIPLLPLFL